MSNHNKTLADAQPGGRVRLSTVLYDRAHDLLGDAYNAGTHGIGYSQQAMELHDAIIPAQPSPGGQGNSLDVLAASIGEVAHRLSTYMPHLSEWADRARDCKKAAEVLAALAARQPVGEPDAYLVQAVKDGETWEHRWYVPRWGDPDPSALEGAVYEIRGSKHPELGIYRVKPFYTAARQPVGEPVDMRMDSMYGAHLHTVECFVGAALELRKRADPYMEAINEGGCASQQTCSGQFDSLAHSIEYALHSIRPTYCDSAESERAAFEIYRVHNLERDEFGRYENTVVADDWAMWQAACRHMKNKGATTPAQAVDLPYSLDADPAGIRARVADVITGTLMVGAQGHTPPPAGHWAEPFWKSARADADAQAVDLGQFRPAVELMEWQERGHAHPDFPEGNPEKHAEALRLLALIDSQAVCGTCSDPIQPDAMTGTKCACSHRPIAWLIEWDNGVTALTKDSGEAAQHRVLKKCKVVPAYARQPVGRSFQAGVAEWMGQCFLPSLYSNMTERGDRLLEEVLELLQAHGYDQARVATLVDYVFGRPVGEPAQEVGGVMVTLAGYCWVAGLDMHAAGDAELARINQPHVMAKIRAKQEAKNALHFDTPLPGNAARQTVGEPFGYCADFDPGAHEFSHTFYYLAPGEKVPEGCTPFFTKQPAQAVDLCALERVRNTLHEMSKQVPDDWCDPVIELQREVQALIDSQAVGNG